MLRRITDIPQEFVDVILPAADGAVLVHVYRFGDIPVYIPIMVAVDQVEE